MSAAAVLQAAIVAVLQQDALLADLRVFDAPPVRALDPYAVVEEPVLAAFDGAGVAGRIGTVAIAFRDGGERPARLRLMMAIGEEDVELLPADLGGGWRLAAMTLARSRLATGKDGWLGRSEWAVRMFRIN